MKFTKTPPTTPGFFIFKREPEDEHTSTCFVSEADIPDLDDGWLWCRLVPIEEVETAYREGYEDRTSFRQLESEDWNRSRAKRVAEGME
jgi:hypothetical protein